MYFIKHVYIKPFVLQTSRKLWIKKTYQTVNIENNVYICMETHFINDFKNNIRRGISLKKRKDLYINNKMHLFILRACYSHTFLRRFRFYYKKE